MYIYIYIIIYKIYKISSEIYLNSYSKHVSGSHVFDFLDTIFVSIFIFKFKTIFAIIIGSILLKLFRSLFNKERFYL